MWPALAHPLFTVSGCSGSGDTDAYDRGKLKPDLCHWQAAAASRYIGTHNSVTIRTRSDLERAMPQPLCAVVILQRLLMTLMRMTVATSKPTQSEQAYAAILARSALFAGSRGCPRR